MQFICVRYYSVAAVLVQLRDGLSLFDHPVFNLEKAGSKLFVPVPVFVYFSFVMILLSTWEQTPLYFEVPQAPLTPI